MSAAPTLPAALWQPTDGDVERAELAIDVVLTAALAPIPLPKRHQRAIRALWDARGPRSLESRFGDQLLVNVAQAVAAALAVLDARAVFEHRLRVDPDGEERAERRAYARAVAAFLDLVAPELCAAR